MARFAASTARFEPGRDGRAHHGVALAGHDGFHVGEVAIDDAGNGDDVADALHGLAQDVVGDAERLEEAGALLDALHQPLVGDHDHGVDAADQFGQRLLGLLHAALAFERERLGDHGDGERAEFAREIGDHGRRAAAGAAAEAGGDEHHVRAVERFEDFLGVLERRLAADLGIRARAEPLGELRAELQLDGRLRQLQRLQVGIGGDEFDAFHLGADHAVDGVRSAAAHADHFDLRAVLRFFRE